MTLNNGVEMTLLGFGIYQIPAGYTERAVSNALVVGYRLLDTAAVYGNEEAVGRAIKSSGIPRENLFVTARLWVQDAPAEDNAKRAIETSPNKLGLDHLDLYLMQQPFGDVYGQRRAMEAVNRAGRAKAIGVAARTTRCTPSPRPAHRNSSPSTRAPVTSPRSRPAGVYAAASGILHGRSAVDAAVRPGDHCHVL